MTAMFPASGVPAADARNSLPDAQVNSLNCDELWYSTSRCQPRFDPAAANALLAEVINTIMKGEVVYDCNYLDRLSLSIRYQIQRGIPKLAVAFGGAPNLYVASVDPPATRLNHGMEIIFVPNYNNNAPGWLTLDGFGPYQILKGNGQSLKANDFIAGYPRLLVFYGSNWWALGPGVQYSDIPDVGTIPRVLTADLDTYVDWRDGSDTIGDGTLGNPFKTINGCWSKVGALYIPSSIYKIRIHLIRPGEHEACQFSGYGGRVEVMGGGITPNEPPWYYDPALRDAYIIINQQDANPAVGNIWSSCVVANGMTALTFYGVNFLMKNYPQATNVQMSGLSVGAGFCAFIDCNITIAANTNNDKTALVWCKLGALVGMFGECDFFTNGNIYGYGLLCRGGDFSSLAGTPHIMRWHPGVIAVFGIYATEGARVTIPGCDVILQGGGPTGPEYRVETNAVVSWNNQEIPGTDGTGSTALGGIWNSNPN